MKVNFGGFVPLSTVDWRGRAVCTVFFRGCPVRCTYCHNAGILAGEDFRPVEEVSEMIRSSLLLISGVIFSGGEPTMQKDALIRLAGDAKAMGLLVGVQTNGVYPGTLESLISKKLVDKVALDIKARWERYNNLLKVPCVDNVRESLSVCKKNYASGDLPEFEVVVTLFRGYEDEVTCIAAEAGDVPLVLQQGVQGSIAPLSEEEMKRIADRLPGPVMIRTREGGEIAYEGIRGRRVPCER
jgi:pyruvate formate lyase activating enzyme